MSNPSHPPTNTLSSQASTTRALTSQVGGHAGVLTTEDGSLLIKPALAAEVAFYQNAATQPEFASLRPFLPKFLGTLKLEGKVDPGTSATEVVKEVTELPATTTVTPEKESLVLENLSFPFVKPNILDVKLGTVLYDEKASPEKRERMTNAAKETTSFETGVRLTGFQVYDNNTGKPVATPKSYGKSIKPADLPDGAARFFPVPSGDASLGLPPKLLLPVLGGIRTNVQEIRDALEKVEMRMVGGSILVIYEGDHTRVAEGLKKLEAGGFDEEDEESGDEDGDEDANKIGPPFLVKVIDFAHTTFVPGQGPDAGVLKGLDTVLGLLDGRIGEVSALQD